MGAEITGSGVAKNGGEPTGDISCSGDMCRSPLLLGSGGGWESGGPKSMSISMSTRGGEGGGVESFKGDRAARLGGCFAISSSSVDDVERRARLADALGRSAACTGDRGPPLSLERTGGIDSSSSELISSNTLSTILNPGGSKGRL